MKESKRILTWITILLAGFLLVGTAVAADYVWVGLGYPPKMWSDELNWEGPPICTSPCYPYQSGDNATIEVDFGETVMLVDEQINDLELVYLSWVPSNIILDGGGTQKVLTCSTVTIVGGDYGTSAKVSGRGVVETQ